MKSINVEKWIIIHAILMIFNGLYVLWTATLEGALLLVLLSFIGLLYLNKASFKQFRPYGGYANWVSLTRLLLLFFLILNGSLLPKNLLFLGLLVCVIMDGLDGWLARRFHQVSDWGGLFDKEIDSFLVWSISLLLYLNWDFSVWIVGIGLLHYIYELLLYFLGWQYLKTPKNPIGRYVAAILFFSLLIPFILPIDFAWPIVVIASIATLVSFSISFFFKYRVAVK